MFTKINLKNERGSVAVFAMVALLLLTTFGFIVVSITTNDMKNTIQALDSTQGEYIANGALLKVLDSYNGIVPKTQTLKNIYTDKNANVYSAVVTIESGLPLLNRKVSVVASKNSQPIYSITAEVSFFALNILDNSLAFPYGYSINSIVQNPISS